MSRHTAFQEEHYLFAGVLMTVLVGGSETEDRYALLVSRVPPGHATPPHLHDRETEISVVLEGTLTAETNGVAKVAHRGEAIQLSPGYAHRLVNAGVTEETHLLLCAPAGFEQFVRAVGTRVNDPSTPPRAMTEEEVKRILTIAPTFGIHFFADQAPLAAPGPGPEDTSLAPFEALGHRIEILARVSEHDDAITCVRATPIEQADGHGRTSRLEPRAELSAATIEGGRSGRLPSPPSSSTLAVTTIGAIHQLQRSRLDCDLNDPAMLHQKLLSAFNQL